MGARPKFQITWLTVSKENCKLRALTVEWRSLKCLLLTQIRILTGSWSRSRENSCWSSKTRCFLWARQWRRQIFSGSIRLWTLPICLAFLNSRISVLNSTSWNERFTQRAFDLTLNKWQTAANSTHESIVLETCQRQRTDFVLFGWSAVFQILARMSFGLPRWLHLVSSHQLYSVLVRRGLDPRRWRRTRTVCSKQLVAAKNYSPKIWNHGKRKRAFHHMEWFHFQME